MSYNVPDIYGKPISLTILNSGVAAKADINFSTYMPKIDLSHASPIIRIVLEDTTNGTTTANIEYTINDRVWEQVTTLLTGKFFIKDEDTIALGDATNAGGHTYRLHITYIAGRIQNT